LMDIYRLVLGAYHMCVFVEEKIHEISMGLLVFLSLKISGTFVAVVGRCPERG